MNNVPLTSRRKQILNFDIENMPLTYYAPDYPTAQITAIASAWTDDPKGTLEVCLLGEDNYKEMLEHFVARYNEADMVAGHYIRVHDLPHINAGLVELGLPHLSAKLVSDTKEDLIKWRGLPKNQEYLAAMTKAANQKVHMTQYDWRDANRLTLDGLARTRDRVASDVRGNIQMRKKLIRSGYLKGPRMWYP